MSAQATVKVAGVVSIQAQVDSAVVKDGALVNPLKNTHVDVTPVISGEKSGVETEASGGREATLQVSYNEGVVARVEYSNEGIGDLGNAVLDSIISDIQDVITAVKQFSLFPSQDSEEIKQNIPTEKVQ